MPEIMRKDLCSNSSEKNVGRNQRFGRNKRRCEF
jgi:hypothetical protein